MNNSYKDCIVASTIPGLDYEVIHTGRYIKDGNKSFLWQILVCYWDFTRILLSNHSNIYPSKATNEIQIVSKKNFIGYDSSGIGSIRKIISFGRGWDSSNSRLFGTLRRNRTERESWVLPLYTRDNYSDIIRQNIFPRSGYLENNKQEKSIKIFSNTEKYL